MPPSTGPAVEKRDGHLFVNNLLTGGSGFTRPLLFVWQPASLCGRLPRPMLGRLDGNAYVRREGGTGDPLILWSPAPGAVCQAAFATHADFHVSHPELGARDREYAAYGGPLFKSPELGDYHLLSAFPGARIGMDRPAEVSALLSPQARDDRFVGAYPVLP